jgi:hypothetical protein
VSADVAAEALQIAAALLILACFLLAQAGRLAPDSYRYLVPNVLGSGILTVTAVGDREWGFVLLEGVWSVVSAHGLLRLLRARKAELVD